VGVLLEARTLATSSGIYAYAGINLPTFAQLQPIRPFRLPWPLNLLRPYQGILVGMYLSDVRPQHNAFQILRRTRATSCPSLHVVEDLADSSALGGKPRQLARSVQLGRAILTQALRRTLLSRPPPFRHRGGFVGTALALATGAGITRFHLYAP